MGIIVWVNVKYFCAGLICDDEGKVIEAAPIVKWARGKHYLDVIQYFQMKGNLIGYESWKEGMRVTEADFR